jgi:hypothetical protein
MARLQHSDDDLRDVKSAERLENGTEEGLALARAVERISAEIERNF